MIQELHMMSSKQMVLSKIKGQSMLCGRLWKMNADLKEQPDGLGEGSPQLLRKCSGRDTYLE